MINEAKNEEEKKEVRKEFCKKQRDNFRNNFDSAIRSFSTKKKENSNIAKDEFFKFLIENYSQPKKNKALFVEMFANKNNSRGKFLNTFFTEFNKIYKLK